ncbi:hypothetical protein SCP_0311780 [Sparassis crispa]|uniref:Uncharacterized protein n=1 Tax=Sparassis crispa TaxID=139825 RepID=A0A401GH00_9APHY|nr:hypothetical protein SCP_0311780 [Sparassis crispa]GBE81449.1 hypothetical protein SCP_0311780 [Sparassis crispa]
MFCPSPVFHDIADSSEWPPQAQEIALLLSQPLPEYISTGPWPFVSPIATHLSDELRKDTSYQEALKPSDQFVSRVHEVFDLVLSTVAALRELESLQDCGRPRPTVTLWSPLFKGIGMACSPDSCYLNEASFVLPRVSPRSNQVAFDGVATVLISHVVDESGFSRSCSPSNAMDVDARFGGTRSQSDGTARSSSHNSMDLSIDGTRSTVDSEGDYADEDQESTDETSQELSGPSIDVPFDAHVLSGSGRRSFAVLPMICVADADNIRSLLTSVAYQRRVWDIDEPVVGFEISKFGTVARILLAWVGTEMDGDCLPAVHIACASTHSRATIGNFDLTDTRSALTLAQIVLGLDAHCQRIVSKSKHRPAIDAYHWRSDYVDEHEDQDNGDLGTRVAHWARTIDARGEGGNNKVEIDLSTPPTSEMTKLPSIIESPGKPTTTESRGRSATRGPTSETGSGSKTSRTGVEQDSVKSQSLKDEKASQMSEPKSRKSRSESATRTDRSSSRLARTTSVAFDGPVTPATWLFERKAFPIGLIKLPDSAEDADEINEKIDVYNKIVVEFAWPSRVWSTVDRMPPVDKAVQKIQRVLFENYLTFAPNEKPAKLDPSHLAILSSRFSTILYASAGAYGRHAALSGLPVNEAEARYDWDKMLLQFCVPDSDRIVSPYVLFERELTFPRNKAVESVSSHEESPELQKDLAQKQVDLALGYRHHCTAVLSSPRFDEAPAPVQSQAGVAWNQALQFSIQIQSLSVKPSKMLDILSNHAASEPLRGICDAIVVSHIVDAFNDKRSPATQKFLKKQALVQHTLTTQPKDKDKSSGELASRPSSQPSRGTPVVRPKKTTSRSRVVAADNVDWQKHVDDPFINSCSPLVLQDPTKSGDRPRDLDPEAVTKDQLLLPVLVVEYKRWNEDQAKSLNQGRFYCVASVTFLAVLGIEGHPVFALVTNGVVGAVLLSWQSPQTKKIYVIERNVCTFDLSKPLQAFHFATFLIRLREQHEKLQALFEAKKTEFKAKVSAEQFEEWTMAAQDVLLRAQRAEAEAAAALRAAAEASASPSDA